MISRIHIVLYFTVCMAAIPDVCFADITVVREVVITPKGVNVAANIGSVNRSVNVRMELAKVDIDVEKPGSDNDAVLPLNVRAVFELINESTENLKLTVGFPISNSQYSAFELSHFRVISNGAIRDVFQRTGSYPRILSHQYVSGEQGPGKALPPSDIDRDTMRMLGEQIIGSESFQNLMVWEETFSAAQQKTIEVYYEIEIPLQENKITRKQVQGNHKGVWFQEANNIPFEFLQKLSPGHYYFFDYYLTSGASWAGPIAFEDVTLHFDRWWQELDFYSTIQHGRLSWSNRTLNPDLPIIAYYTLRDVEPTENIYFAIRPGKKQ